MIKKLIKKILPADLLSFYHRFLALAGKNFYGRPAEKMMVIGVTGTNGKSTTVMLIAKILAAAGYRVGATSTAMFKIGEREWLNDQKMTMLGRFQLPRLLKQMVQAGCRYAVIETSSEGIKQYRHLALNYDVAVFTNLTPEHLEAHGGLANYQKAKEKLFAKLEREPRKTIDGQKVPKVIVVNADDPAAGAFAAYPADAKYAFGLAGRAKLQGIEILTAEAVEKKPDGVSFKVKGERFNLKLLGEFNVYNCLAAIVVAQAQGISLEVCRQALEAVEQLPGRLEFIEAGQKFKVLVDYAPEPESLRQLQQTIKDHQLVAPGRKIIQVLGSCGGGRDRARRPILGALAAQNDHYVIVSNEDPYDDDPEEIIDEVAQGALDQGKVLDQNLFKILDRRQAIKKAFSLAGPGDLVLLTGKGSEQAICLAHGQKMPWDERAVAREELKARDNRRRLAVNR